MIEAFQLGGCFLMFSKFHKILQISFEVLSEYSKLTDPVLFFTLQGWFMLPFVIDKVLKIFLINSVL